MRRTMRALGMVLLLVVVVAGCGVQGNEEPEAIARDNVPRELLDPDPSSSTSLPGTGTPVPVYLIARSGDKEQLAAVDREVSEPSSPGQRVQAVLAPLMDEEVDAGLSTSIPVDTVLNDADLDESTGEVTIDLSSELFNVEGEELSKAFAQVVFTVFELDSVREVRFLVDGEPRQALDDGGTLQDSVTKADYRAYAPD